MPNIAFGKTFSFDWMVSFPKLAVRERGEGERLTMHAEHLLDHFIQQVYQPNPMSPSVPTSSSLSRRWHLLCWLRPASLWMALERDSSKPSGGQCRSQCEASGRGTHRSLEDSGQHGQYLSSASAIHSLSKTESLVCPNSANPVSLTLNLILKPAGALFLKGRESSLPIRVFIPSVKSLCSVHKSGLFVYIFNWLSVIKKADLRICSGDINLDSGSILMALSY